MDGWPGSCLYGEGNCYFEAQMRRFSAVKLCAAATLAIAAGACSRTENGDVVIKRPEVSVKTTEDTMRVPTVTTKIDTVNTPVVGTKTETLVVKKPVVGTKKTQVKVPVVGKPNLNDW